MRFRLLKSSFCNPEQKNFRLRRARVCKLRLCLDRASTRFNSRRRRDFLRVGAMVGCPGAMIDLGFWREL